MTFAVDWALNNNYLSIYLRVVGAPLTSLQPAVSILSRSPQTWELANSIPVHCLMLSAHLLCLPLPPSLSRCLVIGFVRSQVIVRRGRTTSGVNHTVLNNTITPAISIEHSTGSVNWLYRLSNDKPTKWNRINLCLDAFWICTDSERMLT